MYAAGVGAAVSNTSMGPIFAGLFAGPAAPIVMGLAAAVQPLTNIIKGMIQGCGQSCVDATKYADTAEVYLKKMVADYLGNPNRCVDVQTAALQYVDGVFQWLDNGCRAVGGAAGSRCISERLVKGGTAPWCPNPGGRGCDWITLYRDPIANDQPKACGLFGGGGLLGGGTTGGTTGGGGLLGNILGGGSTTGGGGGMDSTMLLIILLIAVILWKKG